LLDDEHTDEVGVVAPAPPPVDDDDLDVEVEFVPAIERVMDDASGTAAPLPEDFYDDIAISAVGDEPPAPSVAAAATPAADSSAGNEEAFDLPISVEPELSAADRAFDPDRTPLPVADAAEGDSATEDEGEREEGRPVVAARLEADRVGLASALPAHGTPLGRHLDDLREELHWYEAERQSTAADHPERIAMLAHAGARVAEKMGDRTAAVERYQTALAADPQHLPSLRGLRRLYLAYQRRDEALALLDRELAGTANPVEARALHAVRAELALALGKRDVAAASYQHILQQVPNDLGALTGLCDVATIAGDEAALTQALAQLSDALASSNDGASRAAFLVERARLAEANGRVDEAAEVFGDALSLDAKSSAAAWGAWRVSLHPSASAQQEQSHGALVALLPEGGLRRALARSLGAVRVRAGDSAGARNALQAAVVDGDGLALADLAALEQREGRIDEALGLWARFVACEPDAGRRADRLITIGELAERKGATAQATAAYARAAAEYPADPRATRALERAEAVGDDKEAALAHHVKAAQRHPARAPMEWTYAARLLCELGRHDEASAQVGAALAVSPSLAPAVDLAVDLAMLAGRSSAA
jgi:tetratricopeptide (TPR) repeat protein